MKRFLACLLVCVMISQCGVFAYAENETIISEIPVANVIEAQEEPVQEPVVEQPAQEPVVEQAVPEPVFIR